MPRSKGRYRQIGSSSKKLYKKRAAINQGWQFNEEKQTWVGTCKNCAVELKLPESTLEHITPRAIGGGNETANLELLCKDCNAIKSVEDQRNTEFFRSMMNFAAPIYLRSIDTEHKKVQCKMIQEPVQINSLSGCLGLNGIPCPFLVAQSEDKILCSWSTSQWNGDLFENTESFLSGVINE